MNLSPYNACMALANVVLCMAIVFMSVCRLNAMRGVVLWRVRLEYSGYVGGALASAVQPYWGELPEWGALALATAVIVGLLCSSRAWRNGPPESATQPAPLEAR